MTRKLLRTAAVSCALLMAASSVVFTVNAAHDEKAAYSWYVRRAKDGNQPVCEPEMSFIEGYDAVYLDKSADARGDKGEHYFSYALYPHEGGLSMDTVRRGYDFNYAPVRTGHQALKAPFTLSGEGSVILETVKHGEDDGIVLRLYEAMGATSSVKLTAPQKELILTNILEDELEPLGAGEVSLTFAPFEIKTIKIK